MKLRNRTVHNDLNSKQGKQTVVDGPTSYSMCHMIAQLRMTGSIVFPYSSHSLQAFPSLMNTLFVTH